MNITKWFMDYYQGNNAREQEPPRGGMKRVGYVMINYTGKLVVINLLFILCCIPVITIPAALSALNCYVGKIFRVGYGVELSDFWKEFKCGIRKNVLLGLINGLIAFYAYYLLSLANNFTGSGQRDVVTGIGIGVAVIAILLGSYSFVLTSMLDLTCRHILKNAGILMIIEWKISGLLVLETVFFWGILLAFVPYSVLPLLLIGFALQQLITCAMLCPIVKKRITEPYENRKVRNC